jgi:dGTPase
MVDFTVSTGSSQEGGLRISLLLWGAFMKYPKESLPKKPTTNIADKSMAFQTDKIFFEEVAADMGMTQCQETLVSRKTSFGLFS